MTCKSKPRDKTLAAWQEFEQTFAKVDVCKSQLYRHFANVFQQGVLDFFVCCVCHSAFSSGSNIAATPSHVKVALWYTRTMVHTIDLHMWRSHYGTHALCYGTHALWYTRTMVHTHYGTHHRPSHVVHTIDLHMVHTHYAMVHTHYGTHHRPSHVKEWQVHYVT